jgi:twitching motility protein PilU
MNLKAIVSQRLVPTVTGSLTVAIEVMLNQGLVRELILKGEISKIRDVMEQNVQMGMCTFDQSFLKLFKEGLIGEDTAISNADQPGDMRMRIQQHKLGGKEGPQALSALDTSRLRVSD